MEHLITVREVSLLSRPISNHIENDRISTYIRESEDIDLKASLGDELMIRLKDHPLDFQELLNGGAYADKCGRIHSFSGLKKTLAYYAYARVVKNNDLNVTRFGVVAKSDDYSERVSTKERIMAYNDAFSVADKYLKECVMYIMHNKEKFPMYKGHGKVKANRISFKVIGD